MRRVILALVVLSLPAAAWADRHRAGANAGVVYAKGSNLYGIQLSFDGTLWGESELKEGTEEAKAEFPELPDHFGTISLVLDTTWVSGDDDEGEHVGRAKLLGGLRLTLNVIPKTHHQSVQPFVHVLGGESWDVVAGAASHTLAVGAGFDWLPAGDDSRGALRFRWDRTWMGSSSKGYDQFSVGVVLRFKDMNVYK